MAPSSICSPLGCWHVCLGFGMYVGHEWYCWLFHSAVGLYVELSIRLLAMSSESFPLCFWMCSPILMEASMLSLSPLSLDSAEITSSRLALSLEFYTLGCCKSFGYTFVLGGCTVMWASPLFPFLMNIFTFRKIFNWSYIYIYEYR